MRGERREEGDGNKESEKDIERCGEKRENGKILNTMQKPAEIYNLTRKFVGIPIILRSILFRGGCVKEDQLHSKHYSITVSC